MHRIVSLADDELDAELREAGLRPEEADHLVKRALRDASRLAAVSQFVPASGPERPARAARRAKRVVVLAVVLFVAAILAGLLLTRRAAGGQSAWPSAFSIAGALKPTMTLPRTSMTGMDPERSPFLASFACISRAAAGSFSTSFSTKAMPLLFR